MKYDTIIIGGGLSGLVAGLALAKKKQKVAIVSLGQSALHFSSGSFGLLGATGGKAVDKPLEAIATLPAGHPYSLLGLDNVKRLAPTVKPFFADAGISLRGTDSANTMRFTPMGEWRPCWLALDEFVTDADLSGVRKALVVSIQGFLDFYPDFVASGLKKRGIDSHIATVSIPAIDRLRKSTAEMRATSIGQQLRGAAIADFAAAINKELGDADIVLMPAVAGLDSEAPMQELRRSVRKPLYCVATTPMSVAGTRMQMQLRRRFQALGGTYLLGDHVLSGHFAPGGALEYVETANLGDERLYADNFVLATGGFFGHGLVAEPHRIYEPVLGLDVDVDGDRDKWFNRDFFAAQPYMKFGVETDNDFHPRKDGKAVANLYAVGALLGGHDALKEESGAGVAILTAMRAAELIVKNN